MNLQVPRVQVVHAELQFTEGMKPSSASSSTSISTTEPAPSGTERLAR